MEIKNNHLRTKNRYTNREIIINLDAIEYLDFIWNPITPDDSYTEIHIGGTFIRIPFNYKLIMEHFDFYSDEEKDNGTTVRDNESDK